jgi:hypothetical protein
VGGRVVLQLLPWLEVVLPRRDSRLVADTRAPAEGRERWIGQLRP